MGRTTAAKKHTPATPAQPEIERYMEVVNAKQQFFSSTFGMGWRLAITVLVPLIAGVKLDDYFDTAPSLTLAGFMIAIFGAVMVVSKSVKEVNRVQAQQEKEKKKDAQ